VVLRGGCTKREFRVIQRLRTGRRIQSRQFTDILWIIICYRQIAGGYADAASESLDAERKFGVTIQGINATSWETKLIDTPRTLILRCPTVPGFCIIEFLEQDFVLFEGINVTWARRWWSVLPTLAMAAYNSSYCSVQ